MLIKPAKQATVPHTGSKLLCISTSLFLISAWENPTIWENTRGISVYSFNEAWGKKEDETLIHNDIINHLRKAFDNWIAFENKRRPMPKKSCRAIPQFENV
jgi:hypothetical protein